MIRELAQGIDGLVTIAVALPGQAVRTVAYLPSEERNKLIKAVQGKLPLGNDMHDNYYFENPQLFKMPKSFREPGPALTPSPVARGLHTLGAYKEGPLTKALPYIAVGIAGLVAYNIIKK